MGTLQVTYLQQHRLICSTVLPAKSDSEVMFYLQRYIGLRIDRTLVY